MAESRPPPPMTADEIDRALDAIGWTTPELARPIKRHRSFVHKLREGDKPVPPWIASFVRKARRAIERLPPPDDPDVAPAAICAGCAPPARPVGPGRPED